jgi:hypothetical protein
VRTFALPEGIDFILIIRGSILRLTANQNITVTKFTLSFGSATEPRVSFAIEQPLGAQRTLRTTRSSIEYSTLKISFNAVVLNDCKTSDLSQIASLGSHPYILEDGPQLPKEFGPHADPGGEVLEGMYAEG